MTVTAKQLKNLTPWQPGQSGNPNGMLRRNLTEAFIRDIHDSWSKHGKTVIEHLAKRDKRYFADLCSRLIPKDIAVSLTERLPGNMDAADWELIVATLNAVKTAIPDANSRRPSDVMGFVLEAIRAHDAKLIEGK